MTRRFPPPPPFNQPLAGARPSAEARALLALRRSANKLFLGEPGPDPAELDELLSIAARVPDHRKLGPWRFIVFEGEARAAFGDGLADILSKRNKPASEVEEARKAFLRAPVVVAVVSSPVDDGRTPLWEQELSAGAVCYNLLLAANASGWAGVWLTEWAAFDGDAGVLLGLKDKERVAGFAYLGTSKMPSPERARADVSERTSRWKA
ncbi:MAG TPA: nitroreductase [Hyphomonas sp.]|mgnify:CR=1 FL=1|nr:nitroreductase [Hyphomonas sp.]HRI99436.1 nitroreductase [Hyphomonas sp.]HRK68325.1 nitroreductase [Hyphomonas sp.]